MLAFTSTSPCPALFPPRPPQPLLGVWLSTLEELEMPRFVLKHPRLLPVLMQNLVAIVQAYRDKVRGGHRASCYSTHTAESPRG